MSKKLKNPIGRFLSRVSVRSIRKSLIFAAGTTVVLIGIALLFLPGPGLAVILLGLALLAIEFVWARVWIKKIKDRIRGVSKKK